MFTPGENSGAAAGGAGAAVFADFGAVAGGWADSDPQTVSTVTRKAREENAMGPSQLLTQRPAIPWAIPQTFRLPNLCALFLLFLQFCPFSLRAMKY